MSTKRVVLRLKPGVAVPYDVFLRSEAAGNKKVAHRFEPDCEVDEGVAARQMKAYPNLFEIAVGKADLSKYPVREVTKQQLFGEVFSKLPADGQLRVFEFARKVQTGAGEEEDDAQDRLTVAEAEIEELKAEIAKLREGVEYEKWTMDALKAEAEEREIEVPKGTDKDGLVELLKK